MKKMLGLGLVLAGVVALSGFRNSWSDNFLARFDGGIGVDPISNVVVNRRSPRNRWRLLYRRSADAGAASFLRQPSAAHPDDGRSSSVVRGGHTEVSPMHIASQ